MYILTRFCRCNFNPKILLRNFLTSFMNFSYTRTDSAIAMATPMRITACLISKMKDSRDGTSFTPTEALTASRLTPGTK